MKNKTITISGASDDIIELGGAICEEFSPTGPDTAGYLAFSDGSLIRYEYSDEGIWRFHVKELGAGSTSSKTEGTDPDGDYTDRIELTGILRWVMHGNEFAKAAA